MKKLKSIEVVKIISVVIIIIWEYTNYDEKCSLYKNKKYRHTS